MTEREERDFSRRGRITKDVLAAGADQVSPGSGMPVRAGLEAFSDQAVGKAQYEVQEAIAEGGRQRSGMKEVFEMLGWKEKDEKGRGPR